MVFASALSITIKYAFKKKNALIKTAVFAILGLFLVRNFFLVLLDKYQVIKRSQASDDPKNAANMIKTLDWVYQKAGTDKFEAYTYVPEVYDYPYQYLYWWYGMEKYGYTPLVASYNLTDVPEYANMANRFMKTDGGGKSQKIALVYENLSKYKDWLNQFKDYCVVDRQDFFWKVSAEIRQKCK
jgi:hypothetical protein